MIQLEKWNILTSSQKLTENVGNFGKIIGATGFEKLPKVQFITQYGHTGTSSSLQPVWPDCFIIFSIFRHLEQGNFAKSIIYLPK